MEMPDVQSNIQDYRSKSKLLSFSLNIFLDKHTYGVLDRNCIYFPKKLKKKWESHVDFQPRTFKFCLEI